MSLSVHGQGDPLPTSDLSKDEAMRERELVTSWRNSHRWTAAMPGVDIVSREQAEAIRLSDPFSDLEDVLPVSSPSESL